MTDKQLYTEYLRDKRVCLVGPSSHILEVNQRDFIESYDVVVRLNRSWPIPEELNNCSGIRTNVLYNCMHEVCMPIKSLIETREFKDTVDFLVCPFPNYPPFSRNIESFKRNNPECIPFVFFDTQIYKQIEKQMNSRPNTGTAAIVHLLLHPIKELHITGMTFLQKYIKGYRDDHKPIHGGVHKPEKQIEYVRNTCWKDPRVTADKVFENIMKGK